MRYFNTFPVTIYNNVLVRNIIARVKVFERAKRLNTIFYQYRVKDGERPDMIAHDYYGNSNYFWIIYLVNDIVDPYFDWPMSQRTFDRYIVEKYGSMAAAQAEIVKYRKLDTAYYLHNTLPSVILTATDYATLSAAEKVNYTQQNQTDDVFITPDTWDRMEAGERDDYEAVYAYNMEFEANEDKRNIRLLNLDYVNRIEEDLVRLMRR
jgi:hypothetical protein